MRVHPDPTKFLVASGSKTGELSIFDASAYAQEWRDGNQNGPTAEEDYCVDDSIIRSQPHYEAITGMYFSPTDANKLITGSHDGTIRLTDVESNDVVTSLAASENELKLTSLDFTPDQPHTVFFSTYDGHMGYHDIRTSGACQPTAVYKLGYAKIGNIAFNPVKPRIFSASSPNRTVKLWDLRSFKTSIKYEPIHCIELNGSASSGHWDSTGIRMVTTSFEHALRVFDTSALLAGEVDKNVSIPQISQTGFHSCRTGQHVTVLQGRFHPDLLVGNRIVTVGDMAWGVRFYSSQTGKPLIDLKQKKLITCTPSVLAYHPLAYLGTSNFGSGLACGNATGRVLIMM
ncbi:hypothetical protein DSO57_1025952 [Entomophthora muscae]|uniref:Uncharacterized protein n=2 Tax=Entomophthora muscae TaxID=34485 RepID=A0ACC2U171_9FUNG|nr:hypothetical protein DSO57_1038081 [Entomophthora muscae]KAJ9080351.1 hypothetical protein DSO57_1025952 [Entomophthora muscae]